MNARASGEYIGNILKFENIKTNESSDNVSVFMYTCYGGNFENI